uniref:Uncharacterized protein n=1 Tax=Arundo donax TaxID=35708 RepID=A0A0A9DTU4_ARUDO
MCLAEDIFP